MLDQSFTPINLRYIYDKENRKGNYLDHHFPCIVEELSVQLKRERAIKKRLQKRKGTFSHETYSELRRRIKNNIKELKNERNIHIDEHLNTISEKISSKKFNLKIERHNTPHHDKQAYKISNNQESFFAEKQLQENIKKTYKVKQSDRDAIISQLIAILGDPFPKHIIRTDISSFYESIDRNKLQNKIDSKPQLSLASRKIIKKILMDYKSLTGSTKGIPRGIGISAYLAELYMKETDEKIKSLPNTIYYTRYVDDIIVVFSPSPDGTAPNHISEVKTIIEDVGLLLNLDKTNAIDFRNGNNFSFDYLGYKFKYSSGLKVGISNNKIEKYKQRITSAFDVYHRGHKGRNARKMLINRIRLLTGNTKLTNNKGGAFVGIYSSNKWANDHSSLKGLDSFLRHKTNQLNCPNLKNRIEKLSFEAGFINRSFRNFSANQLGRLTKAWRL